MLATALTELEDSYISLWGTLSRMERAAVVAVANGLSPTSRRVAADHGTARSSMQRAVERLEGGSQLLARREKQLLLLDPCWPSGSADAEGVSGSNPLDGSGKRRARPRRAPPRRVVGHKPNSMIAGADV